MRTLLLTLGLAALAGPSLALTVQAAPNRDEAPHLRDSRDRAGTPLRDTWAGSARPLAGTTYDGRAPSYGQTQTFSFGSVTTTVRRSDSYDRSTFQDRPYDRGAFQTPSYFDRRAFVPRRR